MHAAILASVVFPVFFQESLSLPSCQSGHGINFEIGNPDLADHGFQKVKFQGSTFQLSMTYDVGATPNTADASKSQTSPNQKKYLHACQRGDSANSIPDGLVSIYFSPRGGCTNAIIQELSKAKSEILVQAYELTSQPIVTAFLDAIKRGVKVSVIVDGKQLATSGQSMTTLKNAGANTYVDTYHKIQHNKTIVLDDSTVITGSFNFSNQAEFSNAENLLIIHDAKIAQLFKDNWNLHFSHSLIYISTLERTESLPRRAMLILP